MSRAFISEDAAAASAAELPERPITQGANPVTPRGLALMEAELLRLQTLRDGVPRDDPARAAAERDLRYWRARLLSAQVVAPSEGTPLEAAFGTVVALRRGTLDVAYQIVGEDEADPAAGLLSWSSPLAQALLGARPGDDIDLGGGRPAMTVLRVAAAPRAAQDGGSLAG